MGTTRNITVEVDLTSGEIIESEELKKIRDYARVVDLHHEQMKRFINMLDSFDSSLFITDKAWMKDISFIFRGIDTDERDFPLPQKEHFHASCLKKYVVEILQAFTKEPKIYFEDIRFMDENEEYYRALYKVISTTKKTLDSLWSNDDESRIKKHMERVKDAVRGLGEIEVLYDVNQ